MNFPKYFDSKNSLNLYGLEKNFHFLSKLYSTKKLPKVLMLSGLKGCGKSTLINHFLFSVFLDLVIALLSMSTTVLGRGLHTQQAGYCDRE